MNNKNEIDINNTQEKKERELLLLIWRKNRKMLKLKCNLINVSLMYLGYIYNIKKPNHFYSDATRPAFFASLEKPLTLNGVGDPLKFDRVWQNYAEGYDRTTGVFTAPKPGLYKISATVMSVNGKPLGVQMLKNNEVIVRGYAPAIHGASHTMDPVVYLKQGDQISIKHRHDGSEEVLHDLYSYMSGYLITE